MFTTHILSTLAGALEKAKLLPSPLGSELLKPPPVRRPLLHDTSIALDALIPTTKPALKITGPLRLRAQSAYTVSLIDVPAPRRVAMPQPADPGVEPRMKV